MGLFQKTIVWNVLFSFSVAAAAAAPDLNQLIPQSEAQDAKSKELDPSLNPALSESKEFEDIGSSQSSEQEILPAPEFLEFSELDPLPEGLIEWSPNSARFLYLSQNELPYVYFMGKIKAGHELMFENQFILPDEEKREFSIRVPLRLKPTVFQFRISDGQGKLVLFRLVNFWLKLPSTFSYKIQTKAGVVEIGKSFYTRFEHSAFAQLYSANHPASIVDLDALKHAELTFRVYAPPKREEVYDAWEIEIRDENAKIISRLKRYGFPPSYVDWRELGLNSIPRGEYTYRINLFNQGKTFEGAANKFQTMEGRSIVKHDFLPAWVLEPRGELGYLRFTNKRQLSYSNEYIAADISLVYRNRYILRGFGMASIHSSDPAATMANARAGAGFRIFGDGYGWLGRPYLFRVDILANYSALTISPDSSVRRFSTFSLLIEPHMVIWRYHYLTPWVEFGSSPSMDTQRLSAGFGYDFYVRPWSVRVGMNIAYDWLMRYTPRPDLRFGVFRTSASFTFFL